MKKVDERDVIFSRMNYEPHTPQFEDYYRRNPLILEQDNLLRALPQMGTEGTATYDQINSPIIDAGFRFLSDIKKYSEGLRKNEKVEVDPAVMIDRIKGLGLYYNAKMIGITEMKDEHYYSHRGRNAEVYGEEVLQGHKFGIVFAVEMDKEMIYRAPQISESVAVTKGYIDAAVVGMMISYYIRELGYDARNHMDGNYLVIAPLVAQDAGLGEIGRNGLLITQEYGPRVRLGVVTTDMPLICDQKGLFGVEQFCLECGKCVKTCPGKAIAGGDPMEIDGIKRWKVNAEECYKRWRHLGTDCGICLASCPFSDEIPSELVSQIKHSKKVREKILEEYNCKFRGRPYISEKPKWLV
ncbi:MAG: 4Fe-4S ferredoxin [Firmicutes bacterium HGW-Firmicutes-7]|nr:MAG: 4Fe-4S ferredoxin [Firmicutes bacterium HGW-Firmicutes-7]